MRCRGELGNRKYRKRPVLASFVLLLGAAVLGTQANCSESTEPAVLTLWQNGTAVALPAETGEAVKTLVAAGERQLSLADGMLRLAVSNDSVEALKKGETAIEIRYATPRSFVLEARGRREIHVEGFLVPLTGEFAEGEIATYFVYHGTWKAGPYRKNGGIPELRRLVAELGVAVPPG